MTRFAYLAAVSMTCWAAFTPAALAGETVSFEMIDTNGDGFITEGEYTSWRTGDGSVTETDAAVEFAVMDVDASGALGQAEFEAAMGEDEEAASDAMGDELN